MTPKLNKPKKPSSTDSVERLGIVDLFFLKFSSRKYYFTVDPKVVSAYRMLPGDLLKVNLIEVRKHRELGDEKLV